MLFNVSKALTEDLANPVMNKSDLVFFQQKQGLIDPTKRSTRQLDIDGLTLIGDVSGNIRILFKNLQFKAHLSSITGLEVLKIGDTNNVVTASEDGLIKVWRLTCAAKDGNWFKQLGEYHCNTGFITCLAVKSMKNFDEFDEKPMKILKRKFPNEHLRDKFKHLATIVAGDRNGSLVVLDVMK